MSTKARQRATATASRRLGYRIEQYRRGITTETKIAFWIFVFHGLFDSFTTHLLHWSVGTWVETNPIMSAILLEYHRIGLLVYLPKISAVALVSLSYPTISRKAELPNWFGWALVLAGASISIFNFVQWLAVIEIAEIIEVV